MDWQLLVFINILAISVASLLQRSILKVKKVNLVSLAITFQVLVALFLGLILIFKGFNPPNFTLLWPNFLLTIFLYLGANILKFRALKKVEVSEFVILFQLSIVTSVIVAIFILGEKFLLTNFLGLILVLFAVTLVTWKNTRLKITRNELVAVGSAVCFGAAFVNDAYILRSTDVFTYSFLAFLAPGLATWGIYNKQVNPFSLFEKKIALRVVLSALLYAVAAISVYTAYQVGRNAAQIQSMNNTQTILIVILAAIFLKERDNLSRKIVAAALSVAGVILLG